MTRGSITAGCRGAVLKARSLTIDPALNTTLDERMRPTVVERDVVEGDAAVMGGGSTAAHMKEIVSIAVPTRSAAHDISKHELAKGLKVRH
jgi:hypothetical protein